VKDSRTSGSTGSEGSNKSRASTCDMCELDALLKDRSNELRATLAKLNPTVDPDWEPIFAVLADIDTTRRMLAADREHA
jgi:hypothetical protein